MFRYRDLPGMLGRVGTTFGAHGINIVSAAVGRQPVDAESGRSALAAMAITTDSAVPRELVAQIVAGDGFDAGRRSVRARSGVPRRRCGWSELQASSDAGPARRWTPARCARRSSSPPPSAPTRWRCGRSATGVDHVRRVRRARAAAGRRAARAGRAPGRHGRVHAHQPPRVPPARHRRRCTSGATPFSIYNTSSPEQIAFLLGDAGNRVMIVEAAFLDRARPGARRPGPGRAPDRARRRHRRTRSRSSELESAAPGGDFDFEATWQAVRPEDMLTLIYTSGTTGPPKGVQLTHANQLAECRGLDETMPVGARRRDGLVPADGAHRRPRAHPLRPDGLGHHGHLLSRRHAGVRPRRRRRPTRFGAVPRVWEKLKAALEAGFAAEPDEARRAGDRRGDRARARQGARSSRPASRCPRELAEAYERADAAVFEPMRARLGFDRCQLLRHRRGAGAAGDVRVLRRDRDPDLRGVGDVGAVQRSPRSCPRTRSASAPWACRSPGVELRLADDGELLVRGGTVMAATATSPRRRPRRSTRDGWLRTGDIGTHRRARLPEDHRPQEGADHQRGRQEHVAGEHRAAAQAGQPADRPGDRDRRPPALQRRADRARPRRAAPRSPRSTVCPTRRAAAMAARAGRAGGGRRRASSAPTRTSAASSRSSASRCSTCDWPPAATS